MKNQEFITNKQAEDAIKKDIELEYQYYAPNQGLAPYFRAEIKKQLDSILQEKKYKNPDGESYNMFQDGLKIYTTLDNNMQRYAEEAMQEHMTNLQRQFEKAYGQNAPWLKNKPTYLAAKKRLKKYQALKKQNLSDQAIEDSLNIAHETKLFSWEEPTIEQMSTLDSLEYYSKFLNAGLLALDPSNGEIKAYVGGIDYRYFQYDHVSQSKRQVGSTFKPIVYTTALENGMDPCSYFSIKEVTYTDVDNWTPTNSSKVEDEDLRYSLKYALSRSVNTISVKVIQETGVNTVIEQAKLMGIRSEIEEVPSIALGTSNLSLIELATAYTTYVNQSVSSKPVFITKIEDKNGHVIATYEDLNPKHSEEKAFSDDTRQVMLEFLKETVNNGTASRLRSTYNLTNNIAGKTGTTQENKDGWFVGVMPKLVTVVWVGNDNQQIGFSNTSIGQGANSALPMFAVFLQKLNADSKYKNLTQAKFENPSEKVLRNADCDLTKEEGFFEQLFGADKKNKKSFKKKKKKGFLSWFKKNKDSV
jgi:penicillin-binding protein 1A